MDLRSNLPVMLASYLYIELLIIVAGQLDDRPTLSRKTSRKFLHAMIGSLPLIMSFFPEPIFPFLVASPFMLVTFLVSPYSPSPSLSERLSSLSEITEEGHSVGLIFYSIS